MLIYVIPTISGVFKELNVALPLATRILIFSSEFVLKYGIFVLIGLAVLIIIFNRFVATPGGKKQFHSFLLLLALKVLARLQVDTDHRHEARQRNHNLF